MDEKGKIAAGLGLGLGAGMLLAKAIQKRKESHSFEDAAEGLNAAQIEGGAQKFLPKAGEKALKSPKNPNSEGVFDELDGLVGLQSVKKEVCALFTQLQIQRERDEFLGEAGKKPAIHLVFTGNPGTGKTTVARVLARLFKKIRLLPTDCLVETDRAGLVGRYVGQTAPLVNKKCDEAMGGVLFIDEAYTLARGGQNDFGQEAIDALLKRMEDDRGKFVVIAAGYENEMHAFVESNPGLKSRFTAFINLPDYTGGELAQIFELYAKSEKLVLADEAKSVLRRIAGEFYDFRTADFANARTIRNFYDKAKSAQAARLSKMTSAERKAGGNLVILTASDLENGRKDMQK